MNGKSHKMWRFESYWGVIPCPWRNSSWRFEGSWRPNQLNCPKQRTTALRGSSQRHETIYPTKQCNIPEELNFGEAACVTSNRDLNIFCRNLLKW